MKAMILLSGGMDSTLLLALAKEKKRECLALSFDYGQRHKMELKAAKAIARHYNVPHKIIVLDPTTFANSALVSNSGVPKNRSAQQIAGEGIPPTYVPARNTLFLAYAASQAEIYGAQEIYFGPNKLDVLPYPDCRPAFVAAFQSVLNTATKQAVEGNPPKLITPLIEWDKTEIIRQGLARNVPFELTFSCYDPTKDEKHCGKCDACTLRQSAIINLQSSLSPPVA